MASKNTMIDWEEDERKIVRAPISKNSEDSDNFFSLKDLFKEKEKKENENNILNEYNEKDLNEKNYINLSDRDNIVYKSENIKDENIENEEDIKVSISSIKQEDLEKDYDLYNSLTFYIEKK